MSGCTALTCLSTVNAGILFGFPMLAFAIGFGIGRILHLVSKMYDAA